MNPSRTGTMTSRLLMGHWLWNIKTLKTKGHRKVNRDGCACSTGECTTDMSKTCSLRLLTISDLNFDLFPSEQV